MAWADVAKRVPELLQQIQVRAGAQATQQQMCAGGWSWVQPTCCVERVHHTALAPAP